jgi:hypothetical protein
MTMSVYSGAELTDEGARYWLSQDGWKENEAAYLLHAIDPMRLERWAQTVGGRLEVAFPEQFDTLRAMIARAFEAGALHSPAKPSDVIAWAKSKQLKLPRQFHDVQAVGTKREPPAERQARLRKACNQRKASGEKAWKKRTADEEGISVSMLDKILRRASDSDKPKAGSIEALKGIGKSSYRC